MICSSAHREMIFSSQDIQKTISKINHKDDLYIDDYPQGVTRSGIPELRFGSSHSTNANRPKMYSNLDITDHGVRSQLKINLLKKTTDHFTENLRFNVQLNPSYVPPNQVMTSKMIISGHHVLLKSLMNLEKSREANKTSSNMFSLTFEASPLLKEERILKLFEMRMANVIKILEDYMAENFSIRTNSLFKKSGRKVVEQFDKKKVLDPQFLVYYHQYCHENEVHSLKDLIRHFQNDKKFFESSFQMVERGSEKDFLDLENIIKSDILACIKNQHTSKLVQAFIRRNENFVLFAERSIEHKLKKLVLVQSAQGTIIELVRSSIAFREYIFLWYSNNLEELIMSYKACRLICSSLECAKSPLEFLPLRNKILEPKTRKLITKDNFKLIIAHFLNHSTLPDLNEVCSIYKISSKIISFLCEKNDSLILATVIVRGNNRVLSTFVSLLQENLKYLISLKYFLSTISSIALHAQWKTPGNSYFILDKIYQSLATIPKTELHLIFEEPSLQAVYCYTLLCTYSPRSSSNASYLAIDNFLKSILDHNQENLSGPSILSSYIKSFLACL